MEPVATEVSVSVSYGGKVQLIKFELSSDYHISIGGKWNVEGLTEREAEAFRYEMLMKFKGELEPVVQAEIDDLFNQKAELNA